MKYLIFCVLFWLSSAVLAYTPPDVKPFVKRVETACPNFGTFFPYTQLKELEGKRDAQDWDLYMTLSGLDWIKLAPMPACKVAVMQNAMEGLEYVVKQLPPTSPWREGARRDYAAATLMFAVYTQPKEETELIERGHRAMKDYLGTDRRPEDVQRSMSYYFAAHIYLEAASMARQPEAREAMLDKAIEVGREGFAKASDKASIAEPLGMALGERSKTLARGSPEFRALMEEGRSVYEQIRGANPLASYFIAIIDVMLNDLDRARRELEDMAAKGKIDALVCSELVASEGLADLRANETDWFRGFYRQQCTGLMSTPSSS